jgi:uncharacterized membrane protein (DUF4010 family)
VDALIYSLVRLGRDQISVAVAARALAAGVAANTGLKLAIALFVGRGPFRAAVGLGLAAVLLSILATLLLF